MISLYHLCLMVIVHFHVMHVVSRSDVRVNSTQHKLQLSNIRQVIKKDKTTDRILIKFPVFVLTFQAGTELRDIYNIKNICQCIIWWEKYKASSPIQQCYRCQKFGHSSRYCGLPARCAKCTKNHNTQECTKQKSDAPTRVNCGGPHPANFSGCPEYQKILLARTQKQSSNLQRVFERNPDVLTYQLPITKSYTKHLSTKSDLGSGNCFDIKIFCYRILTGAPGITQDHLKLTQYPTDLWLLNVTSN